MTWPYTFTVFTPTFNRAATIHRPYESLRAQTFRDFEWLVIDDGSTDGTRAVVEQWQREADFPIRYIWQENRGKAGAHNRAIEEARGRFFLPLDDDDACLPQAMERLYYRWNTIPYPQQGCFSGVTGLCVDQHGARIGDPFPHDVFDSDALEITYRSRVAGEKWGFMRTEILRAFPFPIPDGYHGYVPEGIVWSRIARRYRTRFVNDVLRTFYVGHDSVSRLSRSRLSHMQRNAQGLALQKRLTLNEQIDYVRFAPLEFARCAVHYVRFSLHSGQPVTRQWHHLTNWRARGLFLLSLPAGYVAWQRDKRRGA